MNFGLRKQCVLSGLTLCEKYTATNPFFKIETDQHVRDEEWADIYRGTFKRICIGEHSKESAPSRLPIDPYYKMVIVK